MKFIYHTLKSNNYIYVQQLKYWKEIHYYGLKEKSNVIENDPLVIGVWRLKA